MLWLVRFEFPQNFVTFMLSMLSHDLYRVNSRFLRVLFLYNTGKTITHLLRTLFAHVHTSDATVAETADTERERDAV